MTTYDPFFDRPITSYFTMIEHHKNHHVHHVKNHHSSTIPMAMFNSFLEVLPDIIIPNEKSKVSELYVFINHQINHFQVHIKSTIWPKTLDQPFDKKPTKFITIHPDFLFFTSEKSGGFSCFFSGSQGPWLDGTSGMPSDGQVQDQEELPGAGDRHDRRR